MARVLLIGDGGQPTGFERVCRAIGTALVAAGHTVVQRAQGYDPRKPLDIEYPYTIRPTWSQADDPFGVTKVPRWLMEDKPDVVMMVQDLWNEVNYAAQMPEELPIVGYFPVDAPHLKWSYGLALGRFTRAIPYTHFGAKEAALSARAAADMTAMVNPGRLDEETDWLAMRNYDMTLPIYPSRLGPRQNVSAYTPIPHGLDKDMFQPMNKAECRRSMGIPEDAFVVLNVNTNQFRKRLDITVRGFAELAKWNKKALLLLHCSNGDAGGWDLLELAQLYGVADRMACVHHTKQHLTDQELKVLYNTADIQVNTGGGEGWGLPSFDGALCGIPQMVPNWSATRELWAEDGVLLPIKDYRIPEKWSTTAHACVNAEAYGRLLVQLSKDSDLLAELGGKARRFALAQPSWEEVGARFVTQIEEALLEPTPKPLSIREMLALRDGDLESELKSFTNFG